MKRKVVKHGPSTYIISLPSKWVKKYGVTKGSELEVEINKEKLIITSGEIVQPINSVQVDVTGKLTLIEKIIGAIYRAGYDEIVIRYASNEEHKKIHDVIGHNVIGYEITNEEKNKVLVKSVSRIQPLEFSTMLRRGFLFLINMSEDSLIFLKERKFDDLMGIPLRDNNINKISDFCRRVLNKHGNDEYPRSTTMYSITLALERMGDFYKSIAEYCCKENLTPSKESLELFQKVNDILRQFYECFYDFKLECIQDIMQKKESITKKADELLLKVPNKEIKLLNIINNTTAYISDMTGVLMVNFL